MSSNLVMLDNSGALAEMFKIEDIDSDRGIIERNGYYGTISSLMIYIKGAYSDKFGQEVAQKLVDRLHMTITSSVRLVDSTQAFIGFSVPGLPSGMSIGFRFPKEY